jgi:hypothetical protein
MSRDYLALLKQIKAQGEEPQSSEKELPHPLPKLTKA